VLLGGPLGGFSGAGTTDMHMAAEALLEKATAGLAAEGVEIECRAVEGGAPEVLIAAADEADLLVVGSRGHGGFAGLLLGSVSQQCAHHARCPVVIVHAPTPAATRPDPAEAAPRKRRAAV
jgi:nucleotide-binding universal stress UspA family protein